MRMKKLLTFLTLLTLFFTTAWAETVYKTLDFATATMSKYVNAYNSEFNATISDGSSWLVKCFNNGTSNSPLVPIRAGRNNTASVASIATAVSSPIDKAITKVVVTVDAVNINHLNSTKLQVADNANFTGTSVQNINVTITASGEITYTVPTPTENQYYKLVYNLNENVASNGTLRISKVEYYYNESGSTPTTYSVNLNQTTGGTISASPTTAAEGATVTLTATPNPGYEFTSWEVLDGDANEITVNNNQFTMPASDVEVEATFTALPTYSITVTGGTASPTSAYAGQTVTVTPTIPDGKVVDWDNTTISPASVTLANNGSSYTFTMPNEAVTVVFAFMDAPTTQTATLTNANIVAAGDGSSGYNDWELTDENGKTWNAYAIKNQHSNATSGYHYLQIKKSTTTEQYYVQVPEYGTRIVKLEMTVSNTSQPMTGGSNSATLFFSSSNTTSATGTGVVYGTGASSVTIDCSSLNLNTGYITASGAVRIWDVTVYYENGEATDVVEYYLAGDLNGWGNPVAPDYKFVEQQDGSFVLNKVLPDMENADNIRFKIAKVVNGGTPVMLGANRSGDDYGINWDNHTENFELSSASDAAAFSLSDLFNTTFKLNATATSFTVDKPQLFLVGTFNSYATPNNSSLNGALEMTSAENGGWILTNEFTDGTEFRLYDAWHEYHGGNGAWILETLLGTELNINNDNDKQSIFHIVGNGNYTITVNSDITKLIADRIQEKYSATIASGITGGSVAFNTSGTQTTLNNLTEGYEVRVYVTPSNNYELTTLTYTAEGSTTPVDITTNAGDYYTFNMPAANVTINATFTYNGPAVTTTTYKKITSVEELEAGKKYLIVNESAQKALGGTTNAALDITIANNQTEIGTDSEVAQFVLGGSSTGWTFKNGDGYLTTEDTNNGITMDGTASETSSTWTISFTTQGNAVVTNGTFTTRQIRYYSGTPNFRTYENGSSGAVIQLYKEIGVSAPQFSIPAGVFQNSDYPNGINVALTCATDGATIYYSTDGINFSKYSSAINVTETTTIYAYATKDGKQSNTVSATYTFVDFLVADVVFSPANGDYYHSQTCQMFSTTKGARIYYTTDGSEPVMNQGTTQLYTGEIEMTPGNSYNFKAVAYIGTTPSQVSTANYNILSGDYPGTYNYLYSIDELNTHDQSTSFWTMVNPVQVVYMSTYQNAGNSPEFCLVRDNTGYGMIYFGKNNSYHSGYKVFNMGDWIEGGYYGTISWAYSQQHGQLDTHPELGDSYTNNARIRNWPSSAISNSVVLPEYLTIPQILASGTTGNTDYWGHYVHLRKNTVQLIESDDPGTYTTGQDKDGKWSGTITDENGNQINYYDKFYLQIDKGWTIDNNMFTGHPNRTFDIYGFVACHLPAEIDYQISPFDFAWIDKPVIDKETTTYYEPQTVTITSPDDPTATIWYKTSDMDDYAVYTEPFEVNSTTTVSWYATKQSQYNDELESLIGEITMTFEEIAKPVISPESQVKAVGESVDASIAYEEGNVSPIAVILYTTDGSDPKTSDTAQEYTIGTTTLHFTTTTTVRAITRVGNLYSAEADAKTYTFVKSNGIEYTLIDDATKLKENGVYVIVSQNYSEAMSTTQNVNNRGAAGVLFVEGTNKAKVYGNDDVAQFTLSVLTHDEDTSPERHFLMQTNNSNVNGYLYVGHDVNNSLMTEAEEDAMGNDVAVITIDTDGRAHIHFNYAGGDNRYLQYWNRDRLFNTYKTEYDDRAVYIYGVEATPLATIEKEGVTTEGMNQYTIADELVVVWANADEGMLWCKDQGNVSIAKTEIKDGQVDYMKEVGQQHGEWDQSNWVVLQFPKPTTTENDPIKTLLNNAVGKYIEPATVTGYYIDDNNYTIQMAQAENYTLALKEGADTTKNVYCTANFLPDNLNINGQNGAAGIYHGDNRNYFFMNPKIQEVCSITFAEWTGENTFVVPVNDAQINGSFKVDWAYNAGGPQSPASNTAYRFVAAVQRPQGSTYLKAEQEDPIIVYPLDFTAESALPTAINSVNVNGKAVKSVKYVNVAGIVSDRPFQGVNIVVTEYTDGTRTTSKMLCK